jgi:hypothetical protein
MPRYLLETVEGDSGHLDAAVDLAAQRFPEIELERCDTTGDGVDARVLWMCRAPSETHLHRWAAAARVAVASLRRLSTHELSHPSEADHRDRRTSSSRVGTISSQTGLPEPQVDHSSPMTEGSVTR